MKEYVALVLTQHSALQEEINEIKAPNCTWTTPGKVDPSGSTACAAGITDVGRKAASLSAALKDAMNPAAPTYLGAPPTESRGLTDETIRVSDQLAAAAGGRTAACVTTDGSDCPSKLAAFEYWMRAMSGVFTGWGIVGT